MTESPLTQPNSRCPNCGAKVIGEYCHKCGQSQREYRTSLGHFFQEFLDEYLSFDSKLFRSLIPLLFKPGYLTNEYLSGKRVSLIRPLRLYLFVSFLFFLVISLGDSTNLVMSESEMDAITSDTLTSQINSDDTRKMPGNNMNTSEEMVFAPIRIEFDSAMTDSAKNERFLTVVPNKADPTGNTWDVTMNVFGIHRQHTLTQEKFQRSFINNLPQMMFLLLPIFALLLKLLYIRRQRLYIDHLVFALYTHAFIFLLGILMVLNPIEFIDLLFFLGILVYIYLAMKRVYQQSHLKTALKFSGMFVFYFIILGVALVGNVLISFLVS